MKKILYALFTILMFSNLHANSIKWSSSPTVLSGANFNASDPQVAIDANGNAIAIWIENTFVKSSHKLVNGSWSATEVLSASGASLPRLVSDQNGNATAIWIVGGVVKSVSKTLLGNWGATTALSGTGSSSPVLCVDAAGDVIAAWIKSGTSIESSVKLFGAAWNVRKTVATAVATSLSIAVGGSGSNAKASLVWLAASGTTNVVNSSVKPITGSWTTPVVISETTHNASQPFVAMDGNTNTLVLWYAYDIKGNSYTNVTVKSTELSSSTNTWSSIYSLSQPGIRNPTTLFASAAYDNSGNAMALWTTSFDDETFTIESATKPVNGKWSDPVDLVSSNVYAYSAALSATSFGDMLGLYMFYNGSSLQIQSVESDMNGFLNNSWSVPITISKGTGNAFPKIAATLTGNVIHAEGVWIDFNGVNNVIVSSTGSKTLLLPPTNLSVTQNVNTFGVFNEYYNTLSWTASAAPGVVGYLIFRNGVFVEQVGADVLHFVDDNRALNESVRYSVTAIDNQQVQSTTVSISFP